MTTTFTPTPNLARKLIEEQFIEYASLTIVDVEKQVYANAYKAKHYILLAS